MAINAIKILAISLKFMMFSETLANGFLGGLFIFNENRLNDQK